MWFRNGDLLAMGAFFGGIITMDEPGAPNVNVQEDLTYDGTTLGLFFQKRNLAVSSIFGNRRVVRCRSAMRNARA
jgi:hypothetical protein